MANIDFQPVCSHCRNVIWNVEVAVDVTLDAHVSIIPSVCPHCGEPFEQVTMPTGLPYKAPALELSYTKEGRHYV